MSFALALARARACANERTKENTTHHITTPRSPRTSDSIPAQRATPAPYSAGTRASSSSSSAPAPVLPLLLLLFRLRTPNSIPTRKREDMRAGDCSCIGGGCCSRVRWLGGGGRTDWLGSGWGSGVRERREGGRVAGSGDR